MKAQNAALMQTYSGDHCRPMAGDIGRIDIIDIAHALSMQCRYGGHCLRFYSVAEHCVLLARWVAEQGGSIDLQMQALLHDATETFLPDMIRPIKCEFPDYGAAEARLWLLIASRFGVPAKMYPLVKQGDDRILLDEREQNMRATGLDWEIAGGPLGVALQFWTPDQAKREFLGAFSDLLNDEGLV